MTRTQFQPGAASDHYHDTIGVSESSTPTFLGPFSFTFDAVNNPDDGWGPVLATVPADMLVMGYVLLTTIWDEPGDMQVTLNDGDANGLALVDYNPSQSGSTAVGLSEAPLLFNQGPDTATNFRPKLVRTLQELNLSVAFFPDADDPTQGEGEVWLQVFAL